MNDTDVSPLMDPASVMIGLGALAGLVAALVWFEVTRRLDAKPDTVPNEWLGRAAVTTALALGLASAGYLLGRFTGRF